MKKNKWGVPRHCLFTAGSVGNLFQDSRSPFDVTGSHSNATRMEEEEMIQTLQFSGHLEISASFNLPKIAECIDFITYFKQQEEIVKRHTYLLATYTHFV